MKKGKNPICDLQKIKLMTAVLWSLSLEETPGGGGSTIWTFFKQILDWYLKQMKKQITSIQLFRFFKNYYSTIWGNRLLTSCLYILKNKDINIQDSIFCLFISQNINSKLQHYRFLKCIHLIEKIWMIRNNVTDYSKRVWLFEKV